MVKSKKTLDAKHIYLQVYCYLLALTPLASFFSQWVGNSIGVITYHPWLAMSAWLQVTTCALLFMMMVHVRGLKLSSISLAVLLLFGWLMGSILWAHNRFEALQQANDWLTAVFVFLVATQLFSKQHWFLLTKLLFFSGLVTALLGIGQHVFAVDWVVQALGPASFFGNRNIGAQYILFTFPLGMSLFLLAARTQQRVVYILGVALMLLYIVYTSARAAWLASGGVLVLFALAVVVWRRMLWSRQHSMLLTAAAVVVVLLIPLNKGGYQWAMYGEVADDIASIQRQATTDFNASNVRLIKWRNALDLYRDHWLVGVGLNNWIIAYPPYHQRYGNDPGISINVQSSHTHNDYLQLLVEGGLVAALLIIVLVVLWLYGALLIFRNAQIKREQKIMLAGFGTALLAIGVDAIFSFPLQLSNNMVLFLLYLAAFAWHQQAWVTVTVKHSFAQWAGRLFGLVALASVYLFYLWFQAEKWYRKAYFEVLAGRDEQALQAAERAYHYNPYGYNMLKYRAITYSLNHHPKTEQALLAVAKHYPHNLNSLNRLFGYYFELNQFDKALYYAQRMQTISPHTPLVYRNLAALYQQQGKQVLLLEAVRHYLQLSPNEPADSPLRQLLQSVQEAE